MAHIYLHPKLQRRYLRFAFLAGLVAMLICLKLEGYTAAICIAYYLMGISLILTNLLSSFFCTVILSGVLKKDCLSFAVSLTFWPITYLCYWTFAQRLKKSMHVIPAVKLDRIYQDMPEIRMYL